MIKDTSIQMFYRTKFLGTFTMKQYRELNLYSKKPAIYNGAYIYKESEWFRCDMTPVLLDYVPKEIRLLKLLLLLTT
jgi:hypothetical protein